VGALEADDAVLPLSPEQDFVKQIASQLSGDGKMLPLVIGSYAEGSFRVSVAYWVGAGKPARIDNITALRKQIAAWAGTKPKPEETLNAKRMAEQEARAAVGEMQMGANKIERAALDNQVSAARERSIREFGRFLVCLGYEASKLNEGFYQEMSGNSATAQRLKIAARRLSTVA